MEGLPVFPGHIGAGVTAQLLMDSGFRGVDVEDLTREREQA